MSSMIYVKKIIRLETLEDERKQTEKALRESESRLKTILESVQTGIVIVEAETHRIVDVNAIASKLIGAPKEQIVGSLCHRYICPAETGRCPITDLGQTVDNSERVLLTADGERCPVIKTVVPVILGGRKHLLESYVDITERKQMEEALKQSEKELREQAQELQKELMQRRRAEEELARSNKELEQFAYVASHDLQEPLRMVTSYVQLLARRYKGNLDGAADEFIGFAVDGAARMQRLISDLLTYSRVGTRGKEFEPTDCEIVLQRSLKNLQIAIEEKQAVVTHDPLPTIMADNVQLGQLFQNLIGNAIKFQGTEPPHVHMSVSRNGNSWVFSVRDNGIGIAPEYAEKIFIIFQRLHTRDKYPGTGIGLAVCKKIVERHGGQIWVESESGKGATFCFTLPMKGEPSDECRRD
jgi:PAS domain S-box-containing protein